MALGNHIPDVTIKHEGKRVGWIDSPKAMILVSTSALKRKD